MSEQPWTKDSARQWFDLSWQPMALSMRGIRFWTKRPIAWLPARPLPERFLSLPSRPHECLSDALAAAESFDELRVVLSFAFRDERPSEGVFHVLCLAPDGLPVDPSTSVYGLPIGYLAVEPNAQQLGHLCRLNGLQLPSSLVQ